MAVAVDITLDGIRQSKGFLVQAKINKNIRHGIIVDSIERLRDQCKVMVNHTIESYVFACGNQSTKAIKATGVLSGAPLSELSSKTISDFFIDVMMCWAGSSDIVARDHRELERVVNKMESKGGVLIKGANG